MDDVPAPEPFLEFALRRLDGGRTVLRGVTLPHAMRMYCKGGVFLEDIDFSGWDFTGLILIGIRFRGCSFERAHGRPCISSCEFDFCSFLGATFESGEFGGCEFSSGGMRSSEFIRVEIASCRFWDCSLQQARFDGSLLRYTTFDSCELEGTSLRNVRGMKTHFRRCGMRGAVLEGAHFGSPQFDLVENDMRDTRWRGAFLHLNLDCSGNDVDGADLRGAAVTCADSMAGRALWYIMPSTFTYGRRTRLPIALLPWVYARPRVVIALAAATLVMLATSVLIT